MWKSEREKQENGIVKTESGREIEENGWMKKDVAKVKEKWMGERKNEEGIEKV